MSGEHDVLTTADGAAAAHLVAHVRQHRLGGVEVARRQLHICSFEVTSETQCTLTIDEMRCSPRMTAKENSILAHASKNVFNQINFRYSSENTNTLSWD